MSRHTTRWQQTRHYRAQVSKLLLHYWVLVLVPAICALSDYGVFGISAQHLLYVRLQSTVIVWYVLVVVVAFGELSVVHYSYIYATAGLTTCWHVVNSFDNNNTVLADWTKEEFYKTHISAAGHIFGIIISLPHSSSLNSVMQFCRLQARCDLWYSPPLCGYEALR